MEKGHTYTLDEFRNAQFEQLDEVCTVIILFIHGALHFRLVFPRSGNIHQHK